MKDKPVGKDELSFHLKQILNRANPYGVEEYAVKQLKEIVREHAIQKKQLIALEILFKELQQQQTVTMKSISDFVDKEWEGCRYNEFNTKPESYDVKGMICDLLKKMGIEVEGD
jgi:hypothetical protein